ncbi:hypothetical protein ACFQ1E_19365 [Sphingomonas canadensis]|uniref:HNH endonuclease n=1 Tax=Sphingomonas canadensis TaxID=1219257 RepID=A0ABW3HAI8_9SPHN|nr:hypothetical protein [Sphingomonas canadensis]MCW3838157.1 hypothetical protein [Sphingomonas canadensis]
MTAVCRAPDCTATKLCRAHIVPAGFARTLSAPGGHNKAVRSTGAQRAVPPHGDYDPNILCGDCDTALGRFDGYAIAFCAELPPTPDARTGQVFSHEAFDGAQFARAVLAILWRASISTREQFRAISLGPYEDRAAAILFSGAPLSSLPEFEVVLSRYASSAHDARKFVFMPMRIRSGALTAFTIGLSGFLVWAKVDQRPTDKLLAPFVINAASVLRSPIVRFEESAEYGFFQKAGRRGRERARTS